MSVGVSIVNTIFGLPEPGVCREKTFGHHPLLPLTERSISKVVFHDFSNFLLKTVESIDQETLTKTEMSGGLYELRIFTSDPCPLSLDDLGCNHAHTHVCTRQIRWRQPVAEVTNVISRLAKLARTTSGYSRHTTRNILPQIWS